MIEMSNQGGDKLFSALRQQSSGNIIDDPYTRRFETEINQLSGKSFASGGHHRAMPGSAYVEVHEPPWTHSLQNSSHCIDSTPMAGHGNLTDAVVIADFNQTFST